MTHSNFPGAITEALSPFEIQCIQQSTDIIVSKPQRTVFTMSFSMLHHIMFADHMQNGVTVMDFVRIADVVFKLHPKKTLLEIYKRDCRGIEVSPASHIAIFFDAVISHIEHDSTKNTRTRKRKLDQLKQGENPDAFATNGLDVLKKRFKTILDVMDDRIQCKFYKFDFNYHLYIYV